MSKFNYIYEDPTAGASGSTPFRIYDNDDVFNSESIDVAKFVARRLGHPVMQLEFSSGSIYAMFEEAVSEYSLHINNYNTKNWMWNSYGSSDKITGSLGTGSIDPQHPQMGSTYLISSQYGTEAMVGGDITLYSASVDLIKSQQNYDLDTIIDLGSNDRAEIRRVFNYGPSSITRFYDPYMGSFDQRQMLDAFGMGNVSPAVSFMLQPVSYDIVRAQAIETSDKIRKSAYSFELINNKLRIFPIPQSSGDKIYVQYYKFSDKGKGTRTWTEGKVADPSQMPYKFIAYTNINAAGRQWIRKYCLALSKELLGIIRSKYASIPLPNGEVTMDGEGLKAEGREEKQQLLDELTEFLDSMTLQSAATAESEIAEANQQVLNKAPLKIYIG